MSRQGIAKLLVQYGKELSGDPYTSNKAADRFVRSNSNAWLDRPKWGQHNLH